MLRARAVLLCVCVLASGLSACKTAGKSAQPVKPAAPPERENSVRLDDLGEGRSIELRMRSVLTGKQEVLTLDAETARLSGGFQQPVDAELKLAEGEFAKLFAEIAAVGKVLEYPDRKDKRIASHLTLQGVTPTGEKTERRFKIDYAGDALKIYAKLRAYERRIIQGGRGG
ncbi:MAG: hypothetical protein ABIJ96_11650 [Elusimicrobiota bacterium]